MATLDGLNSKYPAEWLMKKILRQQVNVSGNLDILGRTGVQSIKNGRTEIAFQNIRTVIGVDENGNTGFGLGASFFICDSSRVEGDDVVG